jgi:hypothetical protein
MGEAWIEMVPGDPEIRLLCMGVPSKPNDIESQRRVCAIALGFSERQVLAAALAVPEGRGSDNVSARDAVRESGTRPGEAPPPTVPERTDQP